MERAPKLWQRYGMALAATAVAAAIVNAVPSVFVSAPFPLFCLAVVFSTWCGGMGPGLLATVLGALASAYFALPPRFSFEVASEGHITELVLFVVIGISISLLVNSLHTTRELYRDRARLAAIVEGSYDAIMGKDLNGVITSWNTAAERLFGFPAKEIIGQSIVRLLPEDRFEEEKELLASLSRGEGVEHFQTLRLSRDGRPIDVALTMSPIRDPGGQIVGASTIARDITELKQARDKEQQLVRELEEEHAQLIEAHAQLADADRRKDEFLAMLAHELRNPLAPIHNGVHLLRRAELADPALCQARDIIYRQTAHLARIVDDLLDISRITRGKISLRLQRIEIADAIAQAVETCRPLIDTRRQELQLGLAGEPLLVEGDSTRLAQVVGNLLNNAAKYTQEEGKIVITTAREGDNAVIRVRDNGSGIAPDILPRMFELFAQSERALDRSQGGLGIGLTLVRSLVTMHGGTVTGFSEGPGKGSEFVIRLPLCKAPVGSQPQLRRQKTNSCLPTRHGPSTPTVSRRVLLVEDNQDSAESMRMLLSIWGHAVQIASDGPSALAAVRDKRPDIVLLDIGLPGMDGYEVARQMRVGPRGEELCLVALTGYGGDDDRARARVAGFDHHLVKPVAPESLKELLDVACLSGMGVPPS